MPTHQGGEESATHGHGRVEEDGCACSAVHSLSLSLTVEIIQGEKRVQYSLS